MEKLEKIKYLFRLVDKDGFEKNSPYKIGF
jgi:hypothetical protein